MKYYILLLAILFTPFVSISQSKSMKAIIQVDGVCGMCKNRIEKACLKTKGVKHASWSIETHKLDLIYDARKHTTCFIHAVSLGIPRLLRIINK